MTGDNQYELDEDTLSLVRTVIEMALMTSNLQLNSTDAKLVVDICMQTAARFGIELELVEMSFPEPTEEVTVPQLALDNFPFRFSISPGDKGDKEDNEDKEDGTMGK